MFPKKYIYKWHNLEKNNNIKTLLATFKSENTAPMFSAKKYFGNFYTHVAQAIFDHNSGLENFKKMQIRIT